MARKKATVKLNALDRAIAAVAPAWAAKRLQARATMALAGAQFEAVGGYTGAAYRDGMAYWSPGGSDADMDTVADLQELRNRSRDLTRNSPIATGAIDTDTGYVVGTGLMMQPAIDAEALGLDEDAANEWQCETERRFAMWAEDQRSDAFGELTFYEQQALAYRTSRESGDSPVLLVGKDRPGWPFRLALQVLEADLMSNPQWGADREGLVQGMERDASGEWVAVHVSDRHPGGITGGQGATWSRIPVRGANSGRRNVLLLSEKKRPGQSRGVPALAPIIEVVKQLTRFAEAEVDAAVNSAAMAIFTTMDPDAFQDLFDDEAKDTILSAAQKWDGSIGSRKGQAINLLPGEKAEVPQMGRPNPNFEPFFNAVLQQIGMALDIPHEILTKRFQASYSAARAALLSFWRTVRIRRAWLVARMCQPVYEEWLADEVAAGRIVAAGFFADPMIRRAWSRAQWNGDGPGALDPLKEAQAADLRTKMGLTTLSQEIAEYDGGDWMAKHKQRAREVAERVEDGLEAPAAPAPGTPGMPGAPGGSPGEPAPPGSPNKPGAPAPTEDDDEADPADEE